MTCGQLINSLPRVPTGMGAALEGATADLLRWYSIVTIGGRATLVSWHYPDFFDERIHHTFPDNVLADYPCVDTSGHAYWIEYDSTTDPPWRSGSPALTKPRTWSVVKLDLSSGLSSVLATHTDDGHSHIPPGGAGAHQIMDSGWNGLYWSPFWSKLFMVHGRIDYTVGGVDWSPRVAYMELLNVDTTSGAVAVSRHYDDPFPSSTPGQGSSWPEMATAVSEQLTGTPDGAIWGLIRRSVPAVATGSKTVFRFASGIWAENGLGTSSSDTNGWNGIVPNTDNTVFSFDSHPSPNQVQTITATAPAERTDQVHFDGGFTTAHRVCDDLSVDEAHAHPHTHDWGVVNWTRGGGIGAIQVWGPGFAVPTNRMFFTVDNPIPLQGAGYEVLICDSTNPNMILAVVDRYTGLSFEDPLNDTGSGTVTLNLDDHIFTDPLPAGSSGDLLSKEHFFRVYQDGKHVFTFCAEDVQQTDADQSETRKVTFSGRGIVKMLEEATTLPPNYPAAGPPNHTFTSFPAMGGWKVLFNEARDRGASLAGFITPTFTMGADGAGVPWNDLSDIVLPPGSDLLSLLNRLHSVAVAEWHCSPTGVLDAKLTFGVDRSGTVRFHTTNDVNKNARTRTRRQIRTHVYAQSNDGTVAEAHDATAVTKWRRREQWVTVSDPLSADTLQTYADATLGETHLEAQQVSMDVRSDTQGAVPFIDFNVGDTIGLDDNVVDGSNNFRVQAIAVRVDDSDGDATVSLTLQTRLQQAIIRLQQRLAQMTGGTGVPVSTQSTVHVVANDLAGVTTLEQLSDVNIPAPVDNMVLIRNGTKWTGSWLVNPAGASAGQLLVLSGSLWVPGGDVSSIAPSLAGTWSNTGGSYENAGYRKDADGVVWMRGEVGGGNMNTTILTLPAGYRPAGQVEKATWGVSAATEQAMQLRITSAGVVSVNPFGAAAVTRVSLNVSFHV